MALQDKHFQWLPIPHSVNQNFLLKPTVSLPVFPQGNFAALSFPHSSKWFHINITYQPHRKKSALPAPNHTFKCSGSFLVNEILTYLCKLDKLHSEQELLLSEKSWHGVQSKMFYTGERSCLEAERQLCMKPCKNTFSFHREKSMNITF